MCNWIFSFFFLFVFCRSSSHIVFNDVIYSFIIIKVLSFFVRFTEQIRSVFLSLLFTSTYIHIGGDDMFVALHSLLYIRQLLLLLLIRIL